MGLFEQFPYTNFHELNLDWLIEQLKKLSDAQVLSVNGETGDVILYKDPLVRLPDLTEDTWNIFRYADGSPVGIQFKKGYPLQRIDNLGRYDIYDSNNPPPYPVTAVNGQTGDVVISIPVQSVNGMTGNIILYQQADVEFPALNSGDSWSIWRETENNPELGISFADGQPMARVDNGTAYPVYDAGNPPPYPVTSVAGLTGAVAFLNTQIVTEDQTQKVKILFPVESVDGLTGTVKTWANSANETLKTPAASEGDRWGLARECPSGDIGIRFTYDSNNGVQGYLVFSDGQNPETALRILTPADIPTSAVVSVNGQAGIVVLRAGDIQMSSNDSSTVAANIADRAKLQDIAIVITGNTATVNVTAGQFVYVKGSTITGITDGLYKAVNAIATGTPFTAADLDNTETAAGGFNAVSSSGGSYPNYASAETELLNSLTSQGGTYTVTKNGFIRFIILKSADASASNYTITIDGVTIIQFTTAAGTVDRQNAFIPVSTGDIVTATTVSNIYFGENVLIPLFIPTK